MTSLSKQILADILGVSKRNIEQRVKKGLLNPKIDKITGREYFELDELYGRFPELEFFRETKLGYLENIKQCTKTHTALELFAGAGGLALGLEMAGFQTLLHNEIDKDACLTLRKNRPNWNVINDDIRNIDFGDYSGKVDLLSGGFPCQAFSYAGKKLGFEDIRGTLFFEFARAIKQIQPRVILAENVRGLSAHDSGRTLQTIKNIIDELGYKLIEPKILKAIFYRVPQKRERLFLVAVKKDLATEEEFFWPKKYPKIFTLNDALKSGELYNSDVPISGGQNYPKSKANIMQQVPEGGYWRDLPDKLQREYMKGSYHLGGGKTGMARRLSWDEPSLTLTCAPAQKQTERCHPTETRPLTVREYARIQTFPDTWDFEGSLSSQYKQIGNAVPVNLGHAVATSLVHFLNSVKK